MARAIAPASAADRALLWAASAALLAQGLALALTSGVTAGLASNLVQLLLDGMVVAVTLRAASVSAPAWT